MSSQAYGEAWYWDKRYAKESTTTFDWYQKYESLSPLLHLYLPTTTSNRRVLVVGCDMEMDVRDMKAFEAGSFDAVIDKGTLDSLLCGHNSKLNAAKMLDEIDSLSTASVKRVTLMGHKASCNR
ncbi:methyltransferase-like protein 13 [Tanacetum coccineum]